MKDIIYEFRAYDSASLDGVIDHGISGGDKRLHAQCLPMFEHAAERYFALENHCVGGLLGCVELVVGVSRQCCMMAISAPNNIVEGAGADAAAALEVGVQARSLSGARDVFMAGV